MGTIITEKKITTNLVSPDKDGNIYTDAATKDVFASAESHTESRDGRTVTDTVTFNAASTGSAKSTNSIKLEGFANVEIDDRNVSSLAGGTTKYSSTEKTVYADATLSDDDKTVTVSKQLTENATGKATLSNGTFRIGAVQDANGALPDAPSASYDNLTLTNAEAYSESGEIAGGRLTSKFSSTAKTSGGETVSYSDSESESFAISGSATLTGSKVVDAEDDAGSLRGYKKVTVVGKGQDDLVAGTIISVGGNYSTTKGSTYRAGSKVTGSETMKDSFTASATVNVTDAQIGYIQGANSVTLDNATVGLAAAGGVTSQNLNRSLAAIQAGEDVKVSARRTNTWKNQSTGKLTATDSKIGDRIIDLQNVTLTDTTADGVYAAGTLTEKTTFVREWTDEGATVSSDPYAYEEPAYELEITSENMTGYTDQKSVSRSYNTTLNAGFTAADDANKIGTVSGFRTVKLTNVGGETEAGATVEGAQYASSSASLKRTQSKSGRSTTEKESTYAYADGRLTATDSNITLAVDEGEGTAATAAFSSVTLKDTVLSGDSLLDGTKLTTSKSVSESVTWAKEEGEYTTDVANAKFSLSSSAKETSTGTLTADGDGLADGASLAAAGYRKFTATDANTGDAAYAETYGMEAGDAVVNKVLTKAFGDYQAEGADTEILGDVRGSFTQQGQKISANWTGSYGSKTGGTYKQDGEIVTFDDEGEISGVTGTTAGTIANYATVTLENVTAAAVENNAFDVKRTVKYATDKDGGVTADTDTTTETYKASGKLTAESSALTGGFYQTASIGSIAGVKDVRLTNVSVTESTKLNAYDDDGRNATIVDGEATYTTDGSFSAANTAEWIAAKEAGLLDGLATLGDVKGFKKVTLENIDAKSVTGGADGDGQNDYAAGTFKATSITLDNTIDGDISGYKSVTIDGYTVTGDISGRFRYGKTYGTAAISNATLGGSKVSGYSFVTFKNVTSDVISVLGQGGAGSYLDAGSKDNKVAAYGQISEFETVGLYATVTGADDNRNFSQTVGEMRVTRATLAVEVVDKTLATGVSQTINALYGNVVRTESASKVRLDAEGNPLENIGSVTINNLTSRDVTRTLSVQADIATTISALKGSKVDDTLTFNATGILNLDNANFGEGTDRIVLNLGEEETFNLVGDTVYADCQQLAAKIASTGLEAFAGTGKVVVSGIAASETFDKDLKDALKAAGVAYSDTIKFESAVAAVPKMETIGSTVQTINGYEVRDFIQIAKKGSDCLNSDITLKGGDDTLSFSDDLDWRITGRTKSLDFGAGVDRVSTYTFTQGPKDAKGNYPEPEKIGEAHTVSLTDAKSFANSTLYIASSDALENEFYVSNIEKYDGQFVFKTDKDRTLKVATDTTMQTEGNAKGEIDNTVNAGKEVTATSLVFDSDKAEIGLAKGQILEAKGFTSVQFKELDGVSGLGENAGRVAVYSAKNDSAINSATRTFEKVAEFDVPVQSADVTNLMSVSQTFTGSVTDGTLKIKATAADAEFTVSETGQPTNVISTLTNGIITADSEQDSTRFVVVDFNGSGGQGIGEQVKGDIASASRIGDGTTMVQTVKALKATNTFTYTGILMKTEADAEATDRIIVAKGATAAADDLFTSDTITLYKGTISNLEAGNANLNLVQDNAKNSVKTTTEAKGVITQAEKNSSLTVTVKDGNEFLLGGTASIVKSYENTDLTATGDGLAGTFKDYGEGEAKKQSFVWAKNGDGKFAAGTFTNLEKIIFHEPEEEHLFEGSIEAKSVDSVDALAADGTTTVKTTGLSGINWTFPGTDDALSTIENTAAKGEEITLTKANGVIKNAWDAKTSTVKGTDYVNAKLGIDADGNEYVKDFTDGKIVVAEDTTLSSVAFNDGTDKITGSLTSATAATKKVTVEKDKDFAITGAVTAAYKLATAAGDGLAGKFQTFDSNQHAFVWGGDYKAGEFKHVEKIVFHEKVPEDDYESSIEATSVYSVSDLSDNRTCTVTTAGLKAVNTTYPGMDGKTLSTIDNAATKGDKIALSWANGVIKNTWTVTDKDDTTSTVEGTGNVNATLGIDATGTEYVTDFTQGTIEITDGEKLASVDFNGSADGQKVTGTITKAEAADNKVTASVVSKVEGFTGTVTDGAETPKTIKATDATAEFFKAASYEKVKQLDAGTLEGAFVSVYFNIDDRVESADPDVSVITKAVAEGMTATVVEGKGFNVKNKAKAASAAETNAITVSNVEGAVINSVVRAQITDATGREVQIADMSAAADITHITKVTFEPDEGPLSFERYFEFAVPESATDWNGWEITTTAYEAGHAPTVTVTDYDLLLAQYPGIQIDAFGVKYKMGDFEANATNAKTATDAATKTLTVTAPMTLSGADSYVDDIKGYRTVEFKEGPFGTETLGSVTVEPVAGAESKPALSTANMKKSTIISDPQEVALVVGDAYGFTISGDVAAAYSVDGDHKTNAITAKGDGVKGKFADKESITLLDGSAEATITDVTVVGFGTDDKVTFNDKQVTVTTSAYADKTVISSTTPTSVFTISGDAKVTNGTMSVSGNGVTAKLILNEKVFFASGMTVMAKLTGVKGIVVGGANAVTCETAGNIQEASAEKAKVGTDVFTIGSVSDYTIVNGEDAVSVKGGGVKAKLDGSTIDMLTGSNDTTSLSGATAVKVDGTDALAMTETKAHVTKAGLTGATVDNDTSFEIKKGGFDVTANGTAKVSGNGVKASLNGATLKLNSGMGDSAIATLTKITKVYVGDDMAVSSSDAAALKTATTALAEVDNDKQFKIGAAEGYKVTNGDATVKGNGVIGKFKDEDSFVLSSNAKAEFTDVIDVTFATSGGNVECAESGISSAKQAVSAKDNTVTTGSIDGTVLTGYTGTVTDNTRTVNATEATGEFSTDYGWKINLEAGTVEVTDGNFSEVDFDDFNTNVTGTITKATYDADNGHTVVGSEILGIGNFTGTFSNSDGSKKIKATGASAELDFDCVNVFTGGTLEGKFTEVSFGTSEDQKGTLKGNIDLAAFDAGNSKVSATFSSLTNAFDASSISGAAYDFTATKKINPSVTLGDGDDIFTSTNDSDVFGMTAKLDMGAGNDKLVLSNDYCTLYYMNNIDFGDGVDTLELDASIVKLNKKYSTMDDFVTAFKGMNVENMTTTQASTSVYVYIESGFDSGELKTKLSDAGVTLSGNISFTCM